MKENRGKILFISYLVALVWISLFKFAISWQQIILLANSNSRSLNLIPFGEPLYVNGRINFMESLYNILIFVPFGGLMGLELKKLSDSKKIFAVIGFSVIIESLQFIFSLGASDITDVILNSIGGISGLIIYRILANKFTELSLDPVLIKIGSILLLTCLILISLTFMV